MGSARSHKWAARLRSVGIRRFELVARRLAGYAVAMEVARRAEGPEVNGDLRKTVSRRSLVPSRELKRKGYIVLLSPSEGACVRFKFKSGTWLMTLKFITLKFKGRHVCKQLTPGGCVAS